jgi:hypothetical protein
MSLSPTDRTALLNLATHRIAVGWPAIHFLAALYTRFGTQSAREVTDVIGEGTANLTFGYFSGFIRGTDSTGFRPLVADPDIDNPQTGHFFSYVMWALDGVSGFEAAAALGHEFVYDIHPGHELAQVISGVPDAGAFRALVVSQPLDPNGTLDYAALDEQFRSHGWTDEIVETTRWDTSIPGLAIESDEDLGTGNSVADLRNTVAGFHFGRLVRSGLFASAANATGWLERNVLDGPCRISFAGGVAVLAGRGRGR